jgi:uncharacterized protein
MTLLTYPHFQSISLEMKQALDMHVQRFPPYSDFNVWNLLGWAGQDKAACAFLNDNLIIRSWDCYDDRHVFSLLGVNKIDETLWELLKVTDRLELIPEIVIRHIKAPQYFSVEEDLDNHDYILSTERLTKLTGNSLYSIRVEVSRFPKFFPDYEVRWLDFVNSKPLDDILDLTRRWGMRKYLSINGTEAIMDGITSFLHYAPFFQAVSLGLYVKDKMVAFTINEVVNHETAITHFEIGDVDYEGSARYMTYATSKFLKQQGCIYLNYEQDMGIPGLRKAKRAYRPVGLLKKYNISVTI